MEAEEAGERREPSEKQEPHTVMWGKTKQVCKTSSTFEAGNIRNEAILRDFAQEWKVECRADGFDVAVALVVVAAALVIVAVVSCG